MARNVYRNSYRAQLTDTFDSSDLAAAIVRAKQDCGRLFGESRAMLAGLFRYGRQLFAYSEAVGEKSEPEAFFGALSPFLEDWPGNRKWVYMTPVYFHAEPIDELDWTRRVDTENASGRLAYLKEEMIADYVCSHKLLTNEGALPGDKYTLIALHENVLFQYMEQREVLVNVKRDPELDCAWRDPSAPARSALPDSWLYPNGIPFAMMPEGGRFTRAEKLFVAAKQA